MLRMALTGTGRTLLDLLVGTRSLWCLGTATFHRVLVALLRGEPMRIRPTVRQTVRAGYSSELLVMVISFLFPGRLSLPP